MDMNIQLITVIGKGNMDELCGFNPIHVEKFFGSCFGGEVNTVIKTSLGPGAAPTGQLWASKLDSVLQALVLISMAAWYVIAHRRSVNSSSNSSLLR
jgi:hypothetical protein